MRTLDQIFGRLHPLPGNGVKWERRSVPLTERPGKDIFLIPHHSVSRTLASIEEEFTNPDRTLSATMACGPRTPGVDEYEASYWVPWDTGRPYTTSSWVDDQAITGETANLRLAPPWPVGQSAKYIWAEIAAAMHVELGMPLDTWHIADHQTIAARGWGSYTTECCGKDLRDSIPAYIIPTAKQIAAGSAGGGPEVKTYSFKDRSKKKLAPGTSARLRNPEGAPQNIVGGVGPYSITTNVYASGRPGDRLEVALSLVNTKPNPDVASDSYTQQFELGADGILQESVEFKLSVAAGFAVHSRVRTPGGNVGDVTVTLQDATSYLFVG